MHRELADAIRDASADRLIIRTVSAGSEYAVTVVGLSSEDLQSSTLGSSHADADADEVDNSTTRMTTTARTR